MGSVLKLDFDWTPPTGWIKAKIDQMQDFFEVEWTEKNYKIEYTERGFHLSFYVPESLTEEETCMWQWVFGDDQDRARLNYARMKKGIKNWNKLFVRKVKK